jgi:hypothetical protein
MTLKHLWDPQLSQKEVTCIGMIAIQWAAMEHEIFSQTLATFEPEAAAAGKLPKEMNNLQFTGVLDLWKERVAGGARGRRSKVLLKQYQEVLRLKDFRDALVHGMWHWSESDLGAVFTTRVKKRTVITVKFSAEDLVEFSTRIAEVNFNVRFPGGTIDLARVRMQEGGYISRRAMAMLTGAPVDEEGFPLAHPKAAAGKPEGDA